MTKDEKSELVLLIGNWVGTSLELLKANQREQAARKQLENFMSGLPDADGSEVKF